MAYSTEINPPIHRLAVTWGTPASVLREEALNTEPHKSGKRAQLPNACHLVALDIFQRNVTGIPAADPPYGGDRSIPGFRTKGTAPVSSFCHLRSDRQAYSAPPDSSRVGGSRHTDFLTSQGRGTSCYQFKETRFLWPAVRLEEGIRPFFLTDSAGRPVSGVDSQIIPERKELLPHP